MHLDNLKGEYREVTDISGVLAMCSNRMKDSNSPGRGKENVGSFTNEPHPFHNWTQ